MTKPLYFVEREFPYPVERLWRAWTDPQELENWYCPVFLNVVPGSAISEAVVGGSWAIGVDVSANGFNAYFWGSYQEVIENQKLVHDMCYSQDELEFALRHTQPESHRVEVQFTQLPASCLVRFSQFGQLDSNEAEAAREGMESYFDNLHQHLEKSV
jgi:uncharacterized protein YndB with AHSA1/START domain